MKTIDSGCRQMSNIKEILTTNAQCLLYLARHNSNKKDIKFCTNADAFYYIWGWPGPDANLYYFKDYGITWAFNEEDFREEEVEP